MRHAHTQAISIFAAMIILVAAAGGQDKHCTPVGGMLMTNLGAGRSSNNHGNCDRRLEGRGGRDCSEH